MLMFESLTPQKVSIQEAFSRPLPWEWALRIVRTVGFDGRGIN